MTSFIMCTLPQTVAVSTTSAPFSGTRRNDLAEQYLQIQSEQINTISVTRKVSGKLTVRAVRCYATQTQNILRKSSTATIQRTDPKGKVNGPKLDDGNGAFPPFRFGKGGGGGEGGRNYFGGFFLFACVLLLDYIKEIEKMCFYKGIVPEIKQALGWRNDPFSFRIP